MPASQRTSSVGEGSLGQQPTHYANTTIDTNVVDEVLWFSLRHVRNISHRELYYSPSLDEKCNDQRSRVIFSESLRSRAIFHLD